MISITHGVAASIVSHGQSEYLNGRRESCGLIVDGSYIPCRNLADGVDEIRIDPADWVRAEDVGEIQAIVHSHPDQPPIPSPLDLSECAASGLPWLIVSIPSGAMSVCMPDRSIHEVQYV